MARVSTAPPTVRRPSKRAGRAQRATRRLAEQDWPSDLMGDIDRWTAATTTLMAEALRRDFPLDTRFDQYRTLCVEGNGLHERCTRMLRRQLDDRTRGRLALFRHQLRTVRAWLGTQCSKAAWEFPFGTEGIAEMQLSVDKDRFVEAIITTYQRSQLKAKLDELTARLQAVADFTYGMTMPSYYMPTRLYLEEPTDQRTSLRQLIASQLTAQQLWEQRDRRRIGLWEATIKGRIETIDQKNREGAPT